MPKASRSLSAAEREKARFDRASAERHEAAVQGTVRELGVALQTANEDWVSDLCRRLHSYGSMGRALYFGSLTEEGDNVGCEGLYTLSGLGRYEVRSQTLAMG